MRIQIPSIGVMLFLTLLFLQLHVKAQVPASQQQGTWTAGISLSQYAQGLDQYSWGGPRVRLGYNIADRWTLGLNVQQRNFEGGGLLTSFSGTYIDVSARRYVISASKLSLFVEGGLGVNTSSVIRTAAGEALVGGVNPAARVTPGIQAQVLPWLSIEGSMDFRALYVNRAQELRTFSPGFNLGVNLHLSKRR
ncbi:MAG: hypothetical protein AAFW00_07845 [Bacteroidota bacterium]